MKIDAQSLPIRWEGQHIFVGLYKWGGVFFNSEENWWGWAYQIPEAPLWRQQRVADSEEEARQWAMDTVIKSVQRHLDRMCEGKS